MPTYFNRDDYIAAAQARGLHVVSNAAGEEFAYNETGSFGMGQVDEDGEGYVGMLFPTVADFTREYKAGLPLGCPTGDIPAFAPHENIHVCHWGRYEVLTSAIHTLPIVIVSATTLEYMLNELALWSETAEISKEEEALIREQVERAKAPNEGLLGTAVTESFRVPSLGMNIHIQLA